MYGPVGIAFGVLWLAWFASWIAASWWASRAAGRPPRRDEVAYRVLTAVGTVMVVAQFTPALLPTMAWHLPRWAGWTMLAMACGGLGFTWWARLHLGRLWSARVTRKEAHRIVDTGPYAIVRHPIYTGILAAVYAGLVVSPGPANLLGVLLLNVGFVVKARLEERFLMQELGAAAYEDYRRRVPMLVPFAPARGNPGGL
jgi:protein-S-isoprenylcysteine O-methyltransferase Ste14